MSKFTIKPLIQNSNQGVGAQLSAKGANEADCRSWKEANLPQDGDKLTHFPQTFPHLLHLVTHQLHFS